MGTCCTANGLNDDTARLIDSIINKLINIPAYGEKPPSLKFKYGYNDLWYSIEGSTLTVDSVGALFYFDIYLLKKYILIDFINF